MDLEKNAEDISRMVHKTNDEELQLGQEQKTLMTTLRQKQKKWLGHVLRRDSLLKKVSLVEGRMKGRKKPGRPTEMLLSWLMKKEYKMGYSQLRRMADVRQK